MDIKKGKHNVLNQGNKLNEKLIPGSFEHRSIQIKDIPIFNPQSGKVEHITNTLFFGGVEERQTWFEREAAKLTTRISDAQANYRIYSELTAAQSKYVNLLLAERSSIDPNKILTDILQKYHKKTGKEYRVTVHKNIQSIGTPLLGLPEMVRSGEVDLRQTNLPRSMRQKFKVIPQEGGGYVLVTSTGMSYRVFTDFDGDRLNVRIYEEIDPKTKLPINTVGGKVKFPGFEPPGVLEESDVDLIALYEHRASITPKMFHKHLKDELLSLKRGPELLAKDVKRQFEDKEGVGLFYNRAHTFELMNAVKEAEKFTFANESLRQQFIREYVTGKLARMQAAIESRIIAGKGGNINNELDLTSFEFSLKPGSLAAKSLSINRESEKDYDENADLILQMADLHQRREKMMNLATGIPESIEDFVKTGSYIRRLITVPKLGLHQVIPSNDSFFNKISKKIFMTEEGRKFGFIHNFTFEPPNMHPDFAPGGKFEGLGRLTALILRDQEGTFHAINGTVDRAKGIADFLIVGPQIVMSPEGPKMISSTEFLNRYMDLQATKKDLLMPSGRVPLMAEKEMDPEVILSSPKKVKEIANVLGVKPEKIYQRLRFGEGDSVVAEYDMLKYRGKVNGIIQALRELPFRTFAGKIGDKYAQFNEPDYHFMSTMTHVWLSSPTNDPKELERVMKLVQGHANITNALDKEYTQYEEGQLISSFGTLFNNYLPEGAIGNDVRSMKMAKQLIGGTQLQNVRVRYIGLDKAAIAKSLGMSEENLDKVFSSDRGEMAHAPGVGQAYISDSFKEIRNKADKDNIRVGPTSKVADPNYPNTVTFSHFGDAPLTVHYGEHNNYNLVEENRKIGSKLGDIKITGTVAPNGFTFKAHSIKTGEELEAQMVVQIDEIADKKMLLDFLRRQALIAGPEAVTKYQKFTSDFTNENGFGNQSTSSFNDLYNSLDWTVDDKGNKFLDEVRNDLFVENTSSELQKVQTVTANITDEESLKALYGLELYKGGPTVRRMLSEISYVAEKGLDIPADFIEKEMRASILKSMGGHDLHKMISSTLTAYQQLGNVSEINPTVSNVISSAVDNTLGRVAEMHGTNSENIAKQVFNTAEEISKYFSDLHL